MPYPTPQLASNIIKLKRPSSNQLSPSGWGGAAHCPPGLRLADASPNCSSFTRPHLRLPPLVEISARSPSFSTVHLLHFQRIYPLASPRQTPPPPLVVALVVALACV
ncbi:hypothetical protein L2E82_44112 [Cichorium intybus]|uniref:Uncharacterized protein n=1 Tax=Cichorium intybus TaxID=13427 RepID=A0ACB8ZPP2_CICIN|nr:hypothetical protein L2E82_44112 [Cichorium intybus]